MIQQLVQELPTIDITQPVPKTPWTDVCKTADARKVQVKLLNTITNKFHYPHTKVVLHTYSNSTLPFHSGDYSEILKQCIFAQPWKCPYSSIVITEDEKTYAQLKKENIPAYFLAQTKEIEMCKDFDIVKVLDCTKFIYELEQLPNHVIIDSIKQAIVEEQVKEISIWKHIIQVFCDQEYIESVPILEALSTTAPKVDKDVVIGKIATLNDSLQKELQQLSLPADIVMRAVSRQEIPEQIQELIDTIREDNDFVANSFPLELDEEAFSASQKETRVDCYRSLFKEFMAYDQYKEVLTLLPKILLSLDFYSGIHKSFENALPIKTGNHIELEQSENLFLDKAQPITYSLQETKAAILTGANSGGKTTLLEHVVQVALLKQLRFPASGTTQTPEYDAIYYFAKNSGSTNKGAFETLLTQLSGIAPLKRTLILADEMEAVTEPSVAAKLIAKTMKFFVAKDCDMIFATHLGGILQSEIKGIARIDGICAKGIENGKILIDHNPIMGKLANSTPELIIQKLAKQEPCEFYTALME